jgi:hypothetical protein
MSVATVASDSRVQGRPFALCRGHQARVLNRGGGHWTRRGVPVGKVRPLLAWLHQRHGTWNEVAALLRMSTSTIKGYANNTRRRNVPPEAARRIQQLVVAHRPHRSVLDQWETVPGRRPLAGRLGDDGERWGVTYRGIRS